MNGCGVKTRKSYFVPPESILVMFSVKVHISQSEVTLLQTKNTCIIILLAASLTVGKVSNDKEYHKIFIHYKNEEISICKIPILRIFPTKLQNSKKTLRIRMLANTATSIVNIKPGELPALSNGAESNRVSHHSHQ